MRGYRYTESIYGGRKMKYRKITWKKWNISLYETVIFPWRFEISLYESTIGDSSPIFGVSFYKWGLGIWRDKK